MKVHLKELSEVRNELEMFKNLNHVEDLPYKLGFLTDPMNQKLCIGQQVNIHQLAHH